MGTIGPTTIFAHSNIPTTKPR